VKLVAAVVLAVMSAATLVVAMVTRTPRSGRDARFSRVFARCLRCGITTGAVTGAMIGALIAVAALFGNRRSESSPSVAAAALLYGTLLGGFISVIPSLLGAYVVTGLLPRYPEPSRKEAVEREIASVFRSVVALLDATLLAGIIASGATVRDVVNILPLIVAGNVCVILMLRRARHSIGRTVVGSGQGDRRQHFPEGRKAGPR
jgi:hypothetical protein